MSSKKLTKKTNTQLKTDDAISTLFLNTNMDGLSTTNQSTIHNSSSSSNNNNNNNNNNNSADKNPTRPPSPIYIPTSASGAALHEEDNKRIPKEPSAAAVLSFLKSRGLSKAVVEFHQFLEREKEDEKKISNVKDTTKEGEQAGGTSLESASKSNEATGVRATNKESNNKEKKDTKAEEDLTDMMVDPYANIVSRTELKFNISTGGGLGYDADYMPSTKLDHVPLFDANTTSEGKAKSKEVTGGWDVRRFVHSFTTLQTWVLQQSDDSTYHIKASLPRWDPPDSVKSVISETLHVIPQNFTASNDNPSQIGKYGGRVTFPPPSIKPELMSICFPILVHSYCALLESGFDAIARELWNTWKSLYAPLYPQDVKDLELLTTTKQMKEFYFALVTHGENMVKLKNYKTREIELQQNKEKLNLMKKPQNSINVIHQIDQKLLSYEQEIEPLYKRVKDIHAKIRSTEVHLHKYPFLHRMKSKKYQIQISAHTWRKLAEFLTRKNLAPMYGILQLHCRVIVEARDPMPFSPSGVLEEDNEDTKVKAEKGKEDGITDETKDSNSLKRKGDDQIYWAAPIHPSSRAAEMGEDPNNIHNATKQDLPFPKYYPDDKDIDDSANDQARELESRSIEFNRALRTNGFRRLEALEIVQEYESGMRASSGPKKNAYPGSTLHRQSQRVLKTPLQNLESVADPFSPSILMATCCSGKSISPSSRIPSSALTISSHSTTTNPSTSLTSNLEESGIGITCASMSPIDGRRIATGCEDAAVRIFALDGTKSTRQVGNKGSVDTSISPGIDISDSELILIGHKHGSPVFDVCWNRDGRNLLSAGGDGSLRLWDTMAVGPYGKLSNLRTMKKDLPPNSNRNLSATKGSHPNIVDPNGEAPNADVPGSKPESLVQKHGAALTVYHGHTVNTPIWSCEFSPSGYYFASTGADCTGRIWTTNRPKPVRILVGHYSSVNCLAWHPNCNYILTGSDDKTIRMWDVQSGTCVRVLAGSYSSVNVVKVSPSGRYAAASDTTGVIGLWDLNSGRKVNEFRGHVGEIHSMSYSACGAALATGGDDCEVKVWDVRGAGVNSTVPEIAKAFDYSGIYGEVKRNTEIFEPPGTRKPVNSFLTKQTMILDLQYTKRNLLMSVGKFVAPIGGQ